MQHKKIKNIFIDSENNNDATNGMFSSHWSLLIVREQRFLYSSDSVMVTAATNAYIQLKFSPAPTSK